MRHTQIHGRILWLFAAFALHGIICIGATHAEAPHPDADARYFLGPAAKGLKLKKGCDLSGLDLRGMTLYGDDHYYSGVNFDGANLSGANLEGGDILYTEFTNCTFREATMRKVIAEWVLDSSCDLTDADISGSHIHIDAKQLRSTWNYKNKDLSHTKIRLAITRPGFGYDGLHIKGLDFVGFNLQGTEFISSRRVMFLGADFTDADIGGTHIRLTAEQLRSTKNYKAKNLADITLVGDFSGVSFRAFNLRNTTFSCCNLDGCDFTDAEVEGMGIYRSRYYTTSGDRKWMTSFKPSESRFTKEQLYSTKNYKRRDLDRMRFQGCDFRNADFSNQTLGLFQQCDLQGADFTNADHIRGPDDRWMEHGVLPAPIGFEQCNLSAEQFYSTRIYASRKLQSGCMMARMDLSGWDFSGFDLRSVIFGSSVVTNARFQNARGGDLENAKGLTTAQVKSMWNFQNGRVKSEPGYSLPKDVLKELAEEKRPQQE